MNFRVIRRSIMISNLTFLNYLWIICSISEISFKVCVKCISLFVLSSLVTHEHTLMFRNNQLLIPKSRLLNFSLQMWVLKVLKNYKYCINTSCFLAHSGWKTRLPSTDQSTLLQSYLVVLPAEYRPWCWQAGANLISFLTAKNGRIFLTCSYETCLTCTHLKSFCDLILESSPTC